MLFQKAQRIEDARCGRNIAEKLHLCYQCTGLPQVVPVINTIVTRTTVINVTDNWVLDVIDPEI